MIQDALATAQRISLLTMEDEHKSHRDSSSIDEQRRYTGSFALQFEDAQFDDITIEGDDGHEEDLEQDGRIGPSPGLSQIRILV